MECFLTKIYLILYLLGYARCFHPFLMNIPAEYLLLFAGGVACDLYSLQPVKQGREDGVKLIGSTDKEHLRQVDLYINVLVFEIGVLDRVKHLHDYVLQTGAALS